jgi:hypothetical protein
MYYQSPHVIRKGKIPMITSGTGSAYRRAYAGEVGMGQNYGFLGIPAWKPNQNWLAKCPEMRAFYASWVLKKGKRNAKCKWPYTGKCAKPYNKQLNKLERKGKAAKKVCKGGGKIEEAQMDAIEQGYEVPELETEVVTTEDGGTVVVAGGDPDYDGSEEEEKGIGGTLLIMGLVGGGALLLLLMLKK